MGIGSSSLFSFFYTSLIYLVYVKADRTEKKA